MSTSAGQSVATPERGLGHAGSIVKNRYRVNAIASVGRDVVVYAAEELRYGRPVTLKFLREEAATDPEFVAAVHQQASALAISVHVHRGLPRVYECGTTERGELFIALERTKGTTLREVLDARGALDPASALRIASQVGEALETLHHGHIVHGQLGLESVALVKDSDGVEQVSLLGVELTAAYRTPLGQRRLEASTGCYLAPEQIERGETSDASDQYALGMLLRELLTAGARDTASVETALASLPPEIGRILTTALDPQPERRFPDLSVMVNDMWAAQTALAEPAARPTVAEPRAHRRRRQRSQPPQATLRIAAALFTAGIIAAVVWFVLSGTLVSLVRSVLTTPAVTAVPVAPSIPAAPPAPSPTVREVPSSPPARPPFAAVKDGATAAREGAIPARSAAPVVRDAHTVRDAANAHPSAAPRPAPGARPEEAEPRPPAAREPSSPDGGDGSAIIDWVLSRPR
jgi:serine/threonine-protein kinase